MATNILYLTGTYPQPSETFIAQEMALLKACGIPLVTAAVFRGTATGDPCDIHYLTDRADATIGRTNVVSGLKELVKGPLRRMLSLKTHQAELDALTRLIADHTIGHLHAAFGGLPALLCAAVADDHNLPYSVSVHANDILCSAYDDRFMLDKAERIFVCNRRTMDALGTRSPWTRPKLTYVPHGLRLDEWPFRTPQAVHSPFRFLFVGRLTEKKDPQRAQALVNALNAAGTPADITFIGDGPLKTDAMTVTGFIPRSEVRAYMEQSDALICTSRELDDGDMEGIPNVILEAMASGLPVIATRTGGIGEVVTDETGFPIDPYNTEAFIQLARSLVSSPETYQSRCRTARKLVESGFSAETTIERKVAYFSQI